MSEKQDEREAQTLNNTLKKRRKYKVVASRYLQQTSKTNVSDSNFDNPSNSTDKNSQQKVGQTPRIRQEKAKEFVEDDSFSCSSIVSQVTEAGRDNYQQFLRVLQLQLYQLLFWKYVTNLNKRQIDENQQEVLRGLQQKVEKIQKNQAECSRINILIQQAQHNQNVDKLLKMLLVPLEQWSHFNVEHKALFYKVVQGMESLLMNMPLIDGATVENSTFPEAVNDFQEQLKLTCATLMDLTGDETRLQKTTDLMKSLVDVFKKEEILLGQCTWLLQQFKNKNSQSQCLKCIQQIQNSQTVDIGSWV
eukprot:TRINITY_DN18526_c0_g1_i6.p1 TRINITY_DN18526_c0_g1~~TRINITY_DN18526_c0_g1_i6.p1  ORF type:complete len:331 (-),score=36.87 TRINITY_DN18526_c0_g1_i6:199-1113(-)